MEKVISWAFIRKIGLAVPPLFIEHKVSLPCSERPTTAADLNRAKQILSLTPYFLIFRLLGYMLSLSVSWVIGCRGFPHILSADVCIYRNSITPWPLTEFEILPSSSVISHPLNNLECRTVTHKNKLQPCLPCHIFSLEVYRPKFCSMFTTTKSPSFCMTAFSVILTIFTAVLPQSHDCNYYGSRWTLAPPPLWRQKRTDIRAYDFAYSRGLRHRPWLANLTWAPNAGVIVELIPLCCMFCP